MGRRARFRGAKATPKTLEKDLLEKSRLLAEDPSLLMPECAEGCRGCELRKHIEKMEKVSENRHNERKLDFAMNWGDQLVRAYAATISLHLAGKVPYLAIARTPMGEVSYAVRGKVERDKLIGVQHYDNPELRLMALWKIAESNNLHIYSTQEKAVCSPHGPRPPAEYVEEMLAELPYDVDDEGKCPHPKVEERLLIRWKGADVVISVCPSCVKDSNTVHILASRIAAKVPTDDFDVEVMTGLKCTSDCASCGVKGASDLSKELKAKYLKGELNDSALLEAASKERLERIRKNEDEVYLIGEECFGQDKQRFLAALRGSDAEKEAISKLISSRKLCILSRTDQAANLITDLWPQHRDELLAQVASPDVVKKVLAERSELTPSQMVVEAYRMEKFRGIEATLPRYRKLGPVGSYADRLAKVCKTEGKEAALRQIEKGKGTDHKLRSVSFAFIAALGEGQGKQWQFTREESDFGAYLAPFAQKLIEESGEGYADALKLLLEASGAMEEVERA
ncbi:hypothetical protein [Methanomassiliicoccus luminyensis]|uniref:hypothetical protein n=1 Tax=Methanomassiliicoccus luminyensis TaxID=1080712 RepID=UPI00035EC12B|nr:hypothetical protein [Methanomassiliicoccus luminyensis]